MSRIRTALAAAILCLTAAMAGAQVVGANAFASRSLLTGTSATGSASSVSATAEAGEPAHVGQAAARSVWWRWTAPSSGLVQVDTIGSTGGSGGQLVTRLSVYTGTTLGSLQRVAANLQAADASNYASVVRFMAVSGTSYAIAVDGYTDPNSGITETGTISLHLARPPAGTPPANDNFASATVIPAALGTADGDNTDASVEASEPDPQLAELLLGPAQSVWFTWTPTTSGWHTVQIDASATGWYPSAAVYTGNSLASLTLVDKCEPISFVYGGSLFDTLTATFPAVAGTAYRIQVTGDPSFTEEGPFTVSVQSAERPTNDDFASATDLGTATRAFGSSTLFQGTRQTGEPGHFVNGGLGIEYSSSTIWWKWTAPVTDTVTVDTRGTDGDAFLAVYRAAATPALGTLTFVAAEDDIDYASGVVDAAVTFNATAGTTYYFAVTGYTQASLAKIHLATGARLTPYDAWLVEHPSLTGNDALPGADPDADGFTNLEELVHDMDPAVNAWSSTAERAKVPRTALEGGKMYLDIAFSFPNVMGLANGTSGGTPIVVTPQSASVLGAWTTATEAVFGAEAAYTAVEYPGLGTQWLRFHVSDPN